MIFHCICIYYTKIGLQYTSHSQDLDNSSVTETQIILMMKINSKREDISKSNSQTTTYSIVTLRAFSLVDQIIKNLITFIIIFNCGDTPLGKTTVSSVFKVMLLSL